MADSSTKSATQSGPVDEPDGMAVHPLFHHLLARQDGVITLAQASSTACPPGPSSAG